MNLDLPIRKAIIGTVTGLLLASLLITLFVLVSRAYARATLAQTASIALAVEIRVCEEGPPTCDHTSIQTAVDAANDGDVIKIAAGIYTGSVP